MKIRNLTTLVALGSLLPLAGFSQSGSTGSGSTNPSTTPNQTGSSTYNSTNDPNSTSPGTTGMDRTNTNSGMDRSNSTSTGMDRNNGTYSSATSGDMTGSSIADVRRISQDRLDNRLTAKSLIGEKVVDQDGKDIGRVKDIGLSAVLPQDLQKNSTSSSGMSGSDMSSSSSSAVNTATAGLSSAAGELSSHNVNVYVSVGGFLGAGSELVSVPASQLKREGDHLKIQMSQQQIKSLPSSDSSSSSSDNSNSTSH